MTTNKRTNVPLTSSRYERLLVFLELHEHYRQGTSGSVRMEVVFS